MAFSNRYLKHNIGKRIGVVRPFSSGVRLLLIHLQ